jgi:hypothetical protein
MKLLMFILAAFFCLVAFFSLPKIVQMALGCDFDAIERVDTVVTQFGTRYFLHLSSGRALWNDALPKENEVICIGK